MKRPNSRIFSVTAIVFLLASLSMLLSCRKSGKSASDAVSKGDRHLGVHLSVASGSDYPAAYAKARTAGIDCVPMTLQWSALESGGHYDSAGLLGDLNGFYSGQPVSLSLCLSPFAADRRDLPGDLMSLAFDDPGMLSRFNLLLDTIHSRLRGVSLRYLLIGNESDLYLSENPSEWVAYTSFCNAARRHAQKLWGESLTVGAETTLAATIGSAEKQINTLLDSLDLVCLTYYPLTPDFFMQPAMQARTDFASLFELYPSKPVLFQECGYATGAGCGGSDSAQADFVRTIFALWDLHPSQISYLAFLWLNDLSSDQALQVTEEYGLAGTPAATAFTEYIRTLGVCDVEGNPKPGFQTLQQEALKRGWKD